MAKKEVSAAEITDVLKIVQSNPAAAARLTELLTSGQVEVSMGVDGKLSVRADEVGTAPTSALTSPMKPGAAIDQQTAYKELAQIAGSPEGKIALQKRATGQSLTPREAKLIGRNDALMEANEEQARAERPPLPGKYSTQPEFASRRIRDLVANPDGFARVNDAREAIAEIRATKNHPAFDERHVNYKHAREELTQLYQLAYPPESYPIEKLEGSKE